MSFPWFRLAWCEWRRRPLRSIVAALGVGIATAAVITVLAFERGYQRALEDELTRLGAHVLIVPKGCPYDAASMALHGASWPCYLRTNYLAQVRAVPGIAAAVPLLMTAVQEPSAAAPTVYVGTEPEIQTLKSAWHVIGRFPSEPGEILVGHGAAERRGWKLGDEVDLPGVPQARARVCGRLQPIGDGDDQFIYVRLADAQRWFHHGHELTHMLVRLTDPDRLDGVVSQLRSCDAGMDLNIVPLAHLFRTLQALARSTRAFLGCVAAVALVLAAAGVSNAIFMSLSERIRELGILRTIGASRADVFRLVQAESVLLCLAGALAGIGLAWGFSAPVEAWIRARIPFVPSGPLVSWDLALAAGGLLGSILLGGLAALLPSYRACRLSPREATARPRGT